MHHPASNDTEEVVVPSVAALVGILLTGLLYLVLPLNVIIGPNWLLLVVEGVFVVPLVIDVLTAWDLSHTARRVLVLVPLGVSTLALVAWVIAAGVSGGSISEIVSFTASALRIMV